MCIRDSGDGAILHARKRSNRDVTKAIEDEVFVDLIRDGNHVVLHTKVADDRQLLLREYPAGWIVRRIEEHGLGLLFKGACQFFGVKPVVRRAQRNPDWNTAGKRYTCLLYTSDAA